MRDSALPTVTAICRALIEQIDSGLLSAGGKLPAERKLSELFDTTRITLREALGQLEAQGLIYREERRGWFVSPPRLLYNPLVRSHYHAMVEGQGRVPATEVLSARQVPAQRGDLRAVGAAGAIERLPDSPAAPGRWPPGAVRRALPQSSVFPRHPRQRPDLFTHRAVRQPL